MNGKSGNMNNVLAQIYPTGCFIPGDELIAVFDADQVHIQTTNKISGNMARQLGATSTFELMRFGHTWLARWVGILGCDAECSELLRILLSALSC